MITEKMEVKKDGLSQLQDGCWKLTMKVHPNDMETSLMIAPMGTRYACVLVEIGDDEEPVHEPSKVKDKTEGEKAVIKAALLCKDPEFQAWITRDINNLHLSDDPEIDAIRALRMICGIDSRAELATNARARECFNGVEADFTYRNSRR